MRMIFLVTICVLASLAGCNMESKKASEYKGDGRIEYLPAPPLGISGWGVEFPHFDLSKGIEKTYDLTGLPAGTTYIVYLVVPTDLPTETTEGTFSFRLMQGGKTLKELSPKKISQMINTSSGPQDNNFYYFDQKTIDTYGFGVTKGAAPLKLTITCYNPKLQHPLEAYVKIQGGGFK